jgi:FKBP-type peptidyl-prolyl cis-trans isomerase (trigger factor)
MEQFGIEDEDSFYEIAEDQVKQRMIAKTLMAKENLQMDEDTYTEYLMNYMEYTKKDGKTQEELVEEYTTDYGSRPKDDMYIEYAKNYLAGKANIQ